MAIPKQRLDLDSVDPDANKAIFTLDHYVTQSGLAPALHDLIKIRVSQLNGCAYCLSKHIQQARAAGENPRRLDLLSVWQETGELFNRRERAALAFAEAVTYIDEGGPSDKLWLELTNLFSHKEIVSLLLAINTMNVRNRVAITIRQEFSWMH